MYEKDNLQKFIFEHANIRGEIVHIENTLQVILNQREYPKLVEKLLAEAILSCLLLCSSIKFEGRLDLQFQGDERLPLLLVQSDHNLNIRAYAKFSQDVGTGDYAAAFLNGQMSITISQDKKNNVYQSIIPIQSTSMSENLMHYFAQSEQLSTQLWLAVGEGRAAGMMLQLMPGQDSEQREQFWEYAVQLGQTVKDEELLNLDNQTLLHRLYHETELRLYESKPTAFKCRCNQEKMLQALTILGENEAEEILEEEGKIDVSCDFCNKTYSFDSIDISVLFRKNKGI